MKEMAFTRKSLALTVGKRPVISLRLCTVFTTDKVSKDRMMFLLQKYGQPLKLCYYYLAEHLQEANFTVAGLLDP